MHLVRGTIGAVVGVAIGILVYWLLLRSGIRAPILVPGIIGVVAGLAAGKRDAKMGVITAVISIPATILPDAIWLPFTADNSIGYFLTHLHKLDPIRIGPISLPMLLVYAIGIGLAFWFGMGRNYLHPARRTGDEIKEEADETIAEQEKIKSEIEEKEKAEGESQPEAKEE